MSMKVEEIEARILAEYKKHPNIEWAKIAAIKIHTEIKDQFRNPPKKTIEERKQIFWNEISAFSSAFEPQMLSDFHDYWTEHGPNDKKMRFEKEKSFDIKKRLDRWKRNQKQPTHGRKSADEAIRDILSN